MKKNPKKTKQYADEVIEKFKNVLIKLARE